MQNKFKNKYRIPSARLQTWDYANNGSYFITICTQNRNHFFGKIINQEMQLSEIGKLAEKYWLEIPEHFPFVELGNFVVMPNHFHGILIIDKPNIDSKNVETRFIASDNIDVVASKNIDVVASDNINVVASDNIDVVASKNIDVIASDNIDNLTLNKTDGFDFDHNNTDGIVDQNETRLIASLQVKSGGFSADKNPMLNHTISKTIRWYKGRCSFECRKYDPNFGWQSRFHDHIIRNANAFENIQNYITNNPAKWKEDTFWKE